MLQPFLGGVLLLTLGFLQFSQAQETSSKPEAPTPKKIEAPTPLPHNSSAHARSEEPITEPETVAHLSAFATSLAAYTSAAGCHAKSCTILVTNFTLPDGNTSAYGMEVADQLSSTLAGKEYQLKVIDRALLPKLSGQDRIPDRSINRKYDFTIAETLDSRFMVLGTTAKFENGVVSLSSKVIDVAAKDWDGHNAVVNFGRLNLEVNPLFTALWGA
jgi:hypothetical protein